MCAETKTRLKLFLSTSTHTCNYLIIFWHVHFTTAFKNAANFVIHARLCITCNLIFGREESFFCCYSFLLHDVNKVREKILVFLSHNFSLFNTTFNINSRSRTAWYFSCSWKLRLELKGRKILKCLGQRSSFFCIIDHGAFLLEKKSGVSVCH